MLAREVSQPVEHRDPPPPLPGGPGRKAAGQPRGGDCCASGARWQGTVAYFCP